MKAKMILAGAALALLMPMHAVQAAPDPAEACGVATVKVQNEIFKGLGKGLLATCKGKSAAEIDAKIVAKINKAIDKHNKLAEKIDCAMNQDPNNTTPNTIGDIPPGTLTGPLGIGTTICDGV